MKINGKEVKPLTNYVFIEDAENPLKVEKTDHGIILATDGLAYASDVEGHSALVKTEQQYKYGIVQDVGPDVKALKIGDGVFYYVPNVRPIPIGNFKTLLVAESNILAYARDLE